MTFADIGLDGLAYFPSLISPKTSTNLWSSKPGWTTNASNAALHATDTSPHATSVARDAVEAALAASVAAGVATAVAH